jgi:hypothetical protein
LYNRDGDKWLEIISRLAVNNIGLVSQLCSNAYELQRPIIDSLIRENCTS